MDLTNINPSAVIPSEAEGSLDFSAALRSGRNDTHGWTEERRRKASERIKHQKPWRHSTGPKTLAGKNRSKWNAYKHGFESVAGLKLRHALRLHGLWLRECLQAAGFGQAGGA